MTTNRIARFLLACALAAPAAARAAPSEFVPGEVLVKFREEATPQRRAATLGLRAHSAVAELHEGWTHVKVRPGESVEDALSAYAADPAVEYAQPNFVYRIALAPDDTSYGQLWGFKNVGQTIGSGLVQPGDGLYSTSNPPISGTGKDVNIEPAWAVTTDCRGALVAVLDTGVKYDHQDLAANMWTGGAPNHGDDFVNWDGDPMDENGHGTHVAGTIAAAGNNAFGVAGVCWKAQIMAVRVLDALGRGTSASIIAGINFAAVNGAKVINMSLGGGGSFDQAYSDAITNAQNAGALIVVAAGNSQIDNDGANGPTYPCNFTHPNVLCVAALDQGYALASFSNWGATSVDVGAPGTNVVSTWPGSQTVTSESFFTGWSLPVNGTTGGRWATGSGYLFDPYNYNRSTNLYAANTDDRAYKAFNLSGADVVTMDFGVGVDLAAGTWLRIGCKGSGGDPFSGGFVLDEVPGPVTTGGYLVLWGADLGACATASATVGFQLQSAASRSYGAAITQMTIKKLSYGTASFNTISGTSMATPIVTGVAALLRSYNPAYTFADVVSALKDAGKPVAALAGKTTSGKAVDAMKSLAYVHAPTGLEAVVH